MILVTGGRDSSLHLVEAFLRQDGSPNPGQSKYRKIENLEEASGLGSLIRRTSKGLQAGSSRGSRRVSPGDICDGKACRQACQACPAFSSAALGSVQRSVEDPSRRIRPMHGNLEYAPGGQRAGGEAIHLRLSSSVYGNISSDPKK